MFIEEVRARRLGQGEESVEDRDSMESLQLEELRPHHTQQEWHNNRDDQFFRAQSARGNSRRVRQETSHLIETRRINSAGGRRRVKENLGERLLETSDWKTSLELELLNNKEETEHLVESSRQLEHSLAQANRPREVNKQCAALREKREGIENVQDTVQNNLAKEKANIEKYISKIQETIQRADKQIKINLKIQRTVEQDLFNKDEAFDIDTKCQELHENSTGLDNFTGAERITPGGSIPLSWEEHTASIVRESSESRSKSEVLRREIDSLINLAASDMVNHWSNSNRAFQNIIAEHKQAVEKLKENLRNIDQELKSKDAHIERLGNAIKSTEDPLKVAETRLDERSHRPGVEACHDEVHHHLVEEIDNINISGKLLQKKLEEAQESRNELKKTRANLKHNIALKMSAIDVDEGECMSMRTSFPFKLRCDNTEPRAQVNEVCRNKLQSPTYF